MGAVLSIQLSTAVESGRICRRDWDLAKFKGGELQGVLFYCSPLNPPLREPK